MGNEVKQVGTLHVQCWETKTIHAFLREKERSRELATLNPHFKCFIVLHGALAEERKDRSREGYSGVITLVQARGG